MEAIEYSFESRISETLAGHWSRVPEEIRELSETVLRKRFSGDTLECMEKLRDSFWGQYGLAVASNSKVVSKEVYEGICHRNVFYMYSKDPYKLSYILKPVLPYERALVTLLRQYGIPKLREIMELPVEKNANAILKALKFATDRIYGSPKQLFEISGRVDVKNDSITLEEIDKNIKRIEAELGKEKLEIIDAEFENAEFEECQEN